MPSSDSSVSFLHRLRRGVNWLLSPVGIALARAEKTPWQWGRTVVTTKIGRFEIQVPSDNPIATHYSRFPHLCRQLGRLTTEVRKKYPQMAAIDIGANVGDTACFIKTAEDIPMLCIEGDDCTFSFLEKNIRQFGRTTAHKLFLGERTERIAARFEKAGWNSTIKPGETASGTFLDLFRFDDFIVKQPDWRAFKLMKIDTEGFDCAIIRGALTFIREAAPVITFEYNRENMDAIGEPGIDTLLGLADAGYSRVLLHDANGRFLCSTTLEDRRLIRDLHEYADGRQGGIYFYDVTVFPRVDDDVAAAYEQTERAYRSDR